MTTLRYRGTFLCIATLVMAFAAPRSEAANSCSSAPLPVTPVGPTTTGSFQYSANYQAVSVTAWRLPCSATESMPVLTLVPPPTTTARRPYVCASSLTLVAGGGLQTNAFYFRTDPPTINSFCGDVVAPVTVALVPTSQTPAAFDFDQGFSIDYDGFDLHQSLSIAAYNPAAYNLTPPPGSSSVNLFIKGQNQLFTNCTVTSSGGQYTASCANETPLKSSRFEEFDH